MRATKALAIMALLIFAGPLQQSSAAVNDPCSIAACFNNLIYPWSIEALFRTSATVAVVRIEKSEARSVGDRVCATRYQATVLQLFKQRPGTEDRTTLTFGRNPDLSVGQEYLLFAAYAAEAKEVVLNTRVGDPINEAIDQAPEKWETYFRCGDMVPGFFYLAAWPIDPRGGPLVEYSLPYQLPDSIHADKVAEDQWVLREADVFGYLRSLAATP